jgi:hypothetical protein
VDEKINTKCNWDYAQNKQNSTNYVKLPQPMTNLTYTSSGYHIK